MKLCVTGCPGLVGDAYGGEERKERAPIAATVLCVSQALYKRMVGTAPPDEQSMDLSTAVVYTVHAVHDYKKRRLLSPTRRR